ncbi:MAG: ANTAR domain-containing protein [Acutalibacteraceae bacterium]
MRNIIIAGSASKLIAVLDKMLCQSDIRYQYVCKSASEILALTNEISNAVLVCGPLKDIPSIYLAKNLPDTWDVILLLSSNAPFPYYVSNIIPVNLPINRMELIETILSVAEDSSETYGAKSTAKKVRPKEERELIEKAKAIIMEERKLCESDAHKLLQRYSMNLGITMQQAALRFINSDDQS